MYRLSSDAGYQALPEIILGHKFASGRSPGTPFLDRVAGSSCEGLFSPAIGKNLRLALTAPFGRSREPESQVTLWKGWTYPLDQPFGVTSELPDNLDLTGLNPYVPHAQTASPEIVSDWRGRHPAVALRHGSAWAFTWMLFPWNICHT